MDSADDPPLSRGDERPLGSYAALIGVYTTLVGAFGLWFRRSGRELPERADLRDLALLAVAVHKLARLLSRDRITAPLRAPFTEPAGDAGHGEVEERSRGSGARRAIGQLLVCPYCLGMWTSSLFVAGLLTLPRATRWIASLLSIFFVADLLQIAYRKAADTL